jgi:hypothetical protein
MSNIYIHKELKGKEALSHGSQLSKYRASARTAGYD